MEYSSKIVLFCVIILHSVKIGDTLVMLETSTNLTEGDSISIDFGDNKIAANEPDLQYVDNDVKIPPVTDTGPSNSDIVSDSAKSEHIIESEADTLKDISTRNIPDRNVKEEPPSLIDIGFNEALSQNSGLSDGLTDTAFPAAVSLVDTNSQEFRATLNDEQGTTPFPSNITPPPNTNSTASTILNLVNSTDDHTEYIVKAEPKIILPPVEISDSKNETRNTDTTEINTTTETQNQVNADTEINIPVLDVESNKPKPSETMPVFSEWAQKQLEEAEKNKEEVNVSAQNLAGKNKTLKGVSLKHTSKNYASPDCNAKIISANPESSSMSSVLSPLRDEYALNTCTSKIWFVVELCESIQAKRIDLANFELFSSSPKNFSVSVSTRFPTRDWSNVGQFAAKDERNIQSFDLYPHLFGKYIKVEVQSHYGKEHFCPISLFRVYGTSEFEAFETENPSHPPQIELDEDGDLEEQLSTDERNQTELNLFGSARDAVMSIMKKAAEVLTKRVDSNKNTTVTNDTALAVTKSNTCRTPSHIIVCDNCSDLLYSELYQILSCCNEQLDRLINNRLIKKVVHNTDVCLKYGLDFSNNAKTSVHNETLLFFVSAFEPKYVAAICNAFAILENKVVLNTSYEDVIPNDSNLTTENSDNKTPIMLQTDTLLPSMNYIQNKPEDQMNIAGTINKDTISDILENVASEIPSSAQISPTETSTLDVRVESTQTAEFSNNVDLSTQLEGNENDENAPVANQINENDSERESVTNNGVLLEEQTEASTEDSLKLSTPDQINENFENIFIDLEANDSLPVLGSVNSASTASPATTNIQNVPKESILIRLSNRIKALERNMSLSGQYLEELSRRYRNKVEELHLAFDDIKTTILEESKNRISQDQKKSEEIMILQQQVLLLTNEIRTLAEEKNSIQSRIWWILQFVLIVIVIVYIVMELFYKGNRQFEDRKVKKKRNTIKRRKSVEGVSGHISPSLKKRRPSTEALNICGTYKDLLKQDSLSKIDLTADEMLAFSRDPNAGPWLLSKGDKRRKRKKALRSMSNVAITLSNVQESNNVIRRSSTLDFHTLNLTTDDNNVQVNISNTDIRNHVVLENTSEVNNVKTLVSIDSIPENTTTTTGVFENGNVEKKFVRLSSSGFLRSTLYRSKTSRTDKSLQHKPHNWEWYRRKKNNSENPTNSENQSPVSDVENFSENQVTEVNSDNNSLDSSMSSSINSNNLVERKDKNKTYFKKIFKRVF